jgi:phosphatidylinositol transfer protein SFH5
LRWKAA